MSDREEYTCTRSQAKQRPKIRLDEASEPCEDPVKKRARLEPLSPDPSDIFPGNLFSLSERSLAVALQSPADTFMDYLNRVGAYEPHLCRCRQSLLRSVLCSLDDE